MRRFLIVSEARPDLSDDMLVPNELRGSISRHQIAERLGLSRETTRRKVNQLIKLGILSESEASEIRSVPKLSIASVQRAIEVSLRAVSRFSARLKSFDHQ